MEEHVTTSGGGPTETSPVGGVRARRPALFGARDLKGNLTTRCGGAE